VYDWWRSHLPRILLPHLRRQHPPELLPPKPHKRLPVHEKLRRLANAEAAKIRNILLEDLPNPRLLHIPPNSLHINPRPRQKLPDLLGLRAMVTRPLGLGVEQHLEGHP